MRSSSSRRSRTPQVKAPCAPPLCRARLISLVSPREVGASWGLAAGSLATLASIVSAPCRGTGGFKSRACDPSRMYGAVLAAGNAERVLCECAPVIAPVGAQKFLLPVGDDPLDPDVPDLLEQLSAMPCRVIDISHQSVPALWRASWNVPFRLITSSVRGGTARRGRTTLSVSGINQAHARRGT
jgi:hypothetical protein